jgi:long-chain fatty acid transport protein
LRSLRLTLLTFVVCLAAASAFGSGFSIFEQGAKATGMAGAFVATADDGSAIFYNPAGLAQQREMKVLAGATFITFSNEFRGDPESEVTSGTWGQYNPHTFIPPNLYASMPVGANLTVGVGVFSSWGLRTDWADPWPGRYISRDADLKTASFNPAIAWQTSDGRLAIGGGVEYRRARVFLNANNMALNPFTGRVADVANVRLASEYGDDIGWNLGVLFKPSSRFRIGASYRSEMDIDLEGRAEVKQIPTGNAQFDAIVGMQLPPNQPITTSFPFPAVAIAGIAFSPSDRTDIEFNVSHMTWSRFEELTVNFLTTPAAGFTREQNWKDSSAFRLGMNHRATDSWDVRLGAVYDQNPQPVESVNPLLPDADRIGVTMGTAFRYRSWTAEWALMVLHFKDRDTQGRNPEGFDGLYKTDAMLLGVNLGYRF